MSFASAADIRREVAVMMRSPVRMSVSDAGREYVKVRTPSGGTGPLDPETTPYMVEPVNMLESRKHESVIFVGPAQSGKTQTLIDGWVGYVVKCDPSDMTILQTSQDTARDYSKRRIDRMHRTSPAIKAELAGGSKSDNTYDKVYKAGNILSISWPSINQLSGRAIKRMGLTDYDRMPQDVDREGSPFHLARKRTTTFMSRGMTLVETSPGYEVTEPKWQPHSPHEAPPTRGALSLYNLGDRRRWYWPCPHCNGWFMPQAGIEAFVFKYNKDLFGITDPQIIGVYGVPCPKCGTLIEESYKQEMNGVGIWVPEGCEINKKDKVVGTPRDTKIASYWLPGAAAAFQAWKSIIQNYLNAQREYDITGAEESLKTCVNVDLGAPYLPRRLMSETSAADLEKRAEDVGKRTVPHGVRFLIATVDVQKDRFVVQVDGLGVGFESWLIDRFDIRWSNRKQGDEKLPIDPAGYIEDWDLLTEQVVKRNYPLADESGRKMAVLATGCDSGGKAGVTERAYAYWKKLRGKGLANRLFLLKGERPLPHARKPRVQKVFPDNSSRSARKANARGEIPVWMINTTILKDEVSADLKRLEPGPRYQHYPDWLGTWFYEELTAEVRSDKGWENLGKSRNEAFDLKTYCKGTLLAFLVERRIQEVDWSKPPSWAAEWDDNDHVDLEINDNPVSKRKARVRQRSGFVSGWNK